MATEAGSALGERASHLVLLPSLPSDVSLSSLVTAFEPGLTEILRQIAAVARPRIHLDIAVSIGEDLHLGSWPRSSSYARLQHILSKLYSLICHISAQAPDFEVEAKVDYCVIFTYNHEKSQQKLVSLNQGPIFGFHMLASAQRPWSHVYSLDGEPDEGMLREFINIRKSLPMSQGLNLFDVHRVMGGTRLRLATDSSAAPSNTSDRQHLSIAVGGTFDHLHAGHKLLLTATALVLQPWSKSPDKVERSLTVGITGDELLKGKKFAEILESWEQRQQNVIQFLAGILDLGTPSKPLEHQHFSGTGPNANAVHYRFDGCLTVKCVEISDPYGPTITDETISALVVSGETRSGGKAVNEKRAEKGWTELQVFEISVLDEAPKDEGNVTSTENFQSKISSTAIRKRIREQSASK